MRKLKFAAGAAAGALLAIVAVLAVAKWTLDARYYAGYDPAAPLEARVAGIEERVDYVRTHFYYRGGGGEETPALLATPAEGAGPFPCVVFLHGIGQKKDFLDEIAGPFVRKGFAFVTFDQLMCGERKNKEAGALQRFNDFRRRAAHTVNDARRLVDYLETRPDIAPGRIYLAGASYGAITGAIAAAFDTRFRAVVLTYGGGNLRKMLAAPDIRGDLGGWRPIAQFLGWYFLGVSDPVRYAGRIAPRPVLLQNGMADQIIATAAAVALQDAVKEPKTVKWYPGGHLDADPAMIDVVVDDLVNWLVAQDASFRTAAAA